MKNKPIYYDLFEYVDFGEVSETFLVQFFSLINQNMYSDELTFILLKIVNSSAFYIKTHHKTKSIRLNEKLQASNEEFNSNLDENLKNKEPFYLAKEIEILRDPDFSEKAYFPFLIEEGMKFVRKQNRTSDDWNQAIRFFRIVAKLGGSEGLWRYGRCVRMGWGRKSNGAKGQKLLAESSEKGSLSGSLFHSISLNNGSVEEIETLKRLVSQNHASGIYTYACRLYDGLGIPQNLVESQRLFNLAISLNSPTVLSWIAINITRGDYGFSVNELEAERLKNMAYLVPKSDEEYFYSAN